MNRFTRPGGGAPYVALLSVSVAALICFAPSAATADSNTQACRGLAQALAQHSATDSSTKRLVSQYLDKCGALGQNLCRPPLGGDEGLVPRPSLQVEGSGQMGEATVGSTETTSFIITNARCGQDPLALSLETSGSPFAITGTNCQATLAEGASCTVDVGFSPTVASTYQGSLTARTDAPDSPTSVTISGTGVCQTHSNGLGQTYAACVPLGSPGVSSTYTQEMAFAAAGAWSQGGTIYGTRCGSSFAIVKQSASSAAVWTYSGSLAGYVRLNSANSTGICPTMGDSPWN